jgi:hypothetical protein
VKTGIIMNKNREFKEVRRELSNLKRIPDRDSEIAAAKREAFLVRAEALRKQGIRQPENDTRRTDSRKIRKSWLPKAAGILAALVLALGSVGGTVYASQDSLPDQILYPVKTLVEDTQLRLEKDPEGRLELETTFALRRLEEIQTLINQGQEVPERATRRLQAHLDQMLQQASRFQEGGEGRGMEQVGASFQEMNQVMIKFQTENPGQGQEALNQVREKIQLGLEASGKGSGNGQPQDTDQPGKSDQAPGQDPSHQPGSGKPDQPGEGNQNPGRDWEIPPGQDPDFTPGSGKGNSQ